MKANNLLNLCIADKPVQIETDNLESMSYIKSMVKSHIKSAAKPCFTVQVNTLGQKEQDIHTESIKICSINGGFAFINKKTGSEIGFIDKRKKLCRLNAALQTANCLFQTFLKSSCAVLFPEKGGIVIHSAGIIDKSHAYIFVGPSGAGKTTVSSILKKKGLDVISDDEIIIAKKGHGFNAYSLPWYINKKSVPVKNIFFLKKSRRVYFKRLAFSSAIMKMFPEINYLSDKKLAEDRLNTLSLLVKKIPAYQMEFLKNDSFLEKLKELN